jgi:hypothetical protein
MASHWGSVTPLEIRLSRRVGALLLFRCRNFPTPGLRGGVAALSFFVVDLLGSP